MSQIVSTENSRVAIRISPSDKVILARAAEINNTNITEFVLRLVLPKARKMVAEHDNKRFSQNDLIFMLDLLDNPPTPNERLKKAQRDYQECHHEI